MTGSSGRSPGKIEVPLRRHAARLVVVLHSTIGCSVVLVRMIAVPLFVSPVVVWIRLVFLSEIILRFLSGVKYFCNEFSKFIDNCVEKGPLRRMSGPFCVERLRGDQRGAWPMWCWPQKEQG